MAISPPIYQRPISEPAYPLPEDCYRDADGNLWRRMYRHTGFFDTAGNRLDTPDKILEVRRMGGEVFEDHAEEPAPCMVPPPWATPDQVEELRREARARPCHFWHPQHGWLNWGRKRAQEAPENLGTGSIQRNRRRTVVPVDQDAHYVAPPGAPPPPAADPAEAPDPVMPAEPPRVRRVPGSNREE